MTDAPKILDWPTLYAGHFWSASDQLLDNNGQPCDLTGYTARMQVRRYPDAPVLLDLTTENGRIGLDDPTGTIVLMVDADDTVELTTMEARASLVLVPPTGEGLAFRFREGRFPIVATVTKPTG